MKTSHILKLAKTYLAKNSNQVNLNFNIYERYICYAVMEVQCKRLITENECRAVHDVIRARLGNYVTLEEWLEDVHGIKQTMWWDSDSACRIYEDKIQKTRHAWINSMIEEFEAKGD